MLCDQVEYAKKLINPEIPRYIVDNLSDQFSIRPYQEEAFKNYLVYDRPELRKERNQVLFHMATGSGKTLVMAGLIIHLYKRGYRNFLFFVHLDNILQKTKDNFLNSQSSKYLFAENIIIDGKKVDINEVSTFDESDPNSINICFTTIQGLHSAFTDPREGSLTFTEALRKEVVYISDEAHHLSADTKSRRKSKNEFDDRKSWELVITHYFRANKNNVLLEFTATVDQDNPGIRKEYEDNVVYKYDLKRFRKDRYSKEMETLITNLGYLDMGILSLVLSQYRLKLFNDLKKDIRPIVLFKSKSIAESDEYYNQFRDRVDNLSGSDLDKYSSLDADIVRKAYHYFKTNNISLDLLATEIRTSFSHEHCVQVNQKTKQKVNYVDLNTLELKTNPYRAIFEVDCLNEGWDVLNLFDIVRLYDTSDGKNGIPGSTTIQEAQLIGRGARYCPFVIDDEEEKYKRKFDFDLDNPYRFCETLLYHCKTNPQYIRELTTALIDNGMWDAEPIERTIVIKEQFKSTELYKHGFVFVNDQEPASREHIVSMPASIRDRTYVYHTSGKQTSYAVLFENNTPVQAQGRIHYKTSIGNIADINYNIVHSALRKYPVFSFSNLKKLFPSLKSLREFITNEDYLGNIAIELVIDSSTPSLKQLHEGCINAIEKIAEQINSTDTTYVGTKSFRRLPIKETFRSKKMYYSNPKGDGAGMPQSTPGAYQLDLADKDWYVFSENYGTSEEKAFVKFFNKHYSELKEKYDEIYLVRNERQLHIYSFDEGKRFEPDFLLFLRRKGLNKDYDLLQAFIEPKGDMLLEQDRWKQEFLLQLRNQWKDAEHTFFDDSEYLVIGLPFFNVDHNKPFEEAFGELIIDETRNGYQ